MAEFHIEQKEFKIDLVDFDDGHSPGKTEVPTKLARYPNKNSKNFVMVFDNVLPDEWCGRAYDYAIKKGSPWGKPSTVSITF
jgi:hypothetical protein